MAVEFNMTPLSSTVGVEISGLDLSRTLPPATVVALIAALRNHHLMLFRGLDLTSEDQARFARYFGETSLRELGRAESESADNQYVSNVRPDGIFGKGELDFHIDQLFLEKPLKALILYAVEVPGEGGGTKFLNTQAVYDTMPPDLRARLQGLRCRHARAYDKKTTADWNVVDAAEAQPSWVHPLLYGDPETGRQAIWVNKLTTLGIEGLPADESAALIAEVRAYFYDDAFTYSHAWETGDMILWNNLVLQHARLPFDPGTARTLRRTAIL